MLELGCPGPAAPLHSLEHGLEGLGGLFHAAFLRGGGCPLHPPSLPPPPPTWLALALKSSRVRKSCSSSFLSCGGAGASSRGG